MKIVGKINWSNLLGDIRFWVYVFFILRLYGITNPPVDPASEWRQCDVLMIARNFLDVDSNIFYPRIDLGGNPSGSLVGVEFPILNYLIYLVSLIFGYQDWYGRLINLVVTSIALLYLHRLLKRYISESAAFNATMVLLFSGWFAYSRITIPDVFAGSLCIISLDYAFAYFERGNYKDVVIFTIVASLGCLSKISAASLLTILIAPMLNKELQLNKKLILTLSATIILGLVYTWYFNWVPYLNSIGEADYFFMGMPLTEGIHDILANPLLYLKVLLEDPVKYIGGVIFLFSCYYMIKCKRLLMLLILLVPFFGFWIFVIKSGQWFYINGYYFLMFVPSMAVIVGFGLSLLKSRVIQLILLSAVAVENIANQVHIFQVRPYEPYTQLESIFDRVGAGKHDLVAICSRKGSPVAIYFTHRKGWNLRSYQLKEVNTITDLKRKECKYILVLKKDDEDDLEIPYAIIYNSDDFKIYKL